MSKILNKGHPPVQTKENEVRPDFVFDTQDINDKRRKNNEKGNAILQYRTVDERTCIFSIVKILGKDP